MFYRADDYNGTWNITKSMRLREKKIWKIRNFDKSFVFFFQKREKSDIDFYSSFGEIRRYFNIIYSSVWLLGVWGKLYNFSRKLEYRIIIHQKSHLYRRNIAKIVKFKCLKSTPEQLPKFNENYSTLLPLFVPRRHNVNLIFRLSLQKPPTVGYLHISM